MFRERLRRWRFYHQIRTDPDSPVRAPQIGTRTPVLAHDGHDLASALQTIIEKGRRSPEDRRAGVEVDDVKLEALVRTITGNTRHLVGGEDRSHAIASVEMVDAVVV